MIKLFFQKEWWDTFIWKFNIKEFLALVFLPVWVSAALVFWMIFILTAQLQLSTPSTPKSKALIENNCINIPKTTEGVDNKVCWSWVYHGETSEQSSSSMPMTKNNFWSLLVQIFGIMFLWMALMAAIKTSKIVAEVASPIENIWKSVWELMKKLHKIFHLFLDEKMLNEILYQYEFDDYQMLLQMI